MRLRTRYTRNISSPCCRADLDLHLRRLRQGARARAVGDRWRGAATEDLRADGQVEFVHQAGTEQGVIQLATAFAEQPLDSPLLAQPAQGTGEINFLRAANLDFRPDCAQRLQPVGRARGGS